LIRKNFIKKLKHFGEIMKKRILILCTGNSCRSQMAEGFLKSFDKNLEVYSAGTKPAGKVNPNAIKVMNEVGIDLSKNHPKMVDQFLNDSFDYVITVCDNAKETCPVFIGKVGKQLHIGFEDPADATGTEEEILSVFRKVRDEIERDFYEFYLKELKEK
jgi:arsenate reductase